MGTLWGLLNFTPYIIIIIKKIVLYWVFLLQLKDIELTWQDRERDLQDQNCKLLKAQDTLKEETKALENSLLSDKDHRLQAAKKVCTSLQNEVSLWIIYGTTVMIINYFNIKYKTVIVKDLILFHFI